MKQNTKEGQRGRIQRRAFAILLALILVIGIAIAFLMNLYRLKNNEVYSALVGESLSSTHNAQTTEVKRAISEACNLLQSVAAVYSTSDQALDGEWSTRYLQAIKEVNMLYDVQYMSIDSLKLVFESEASLERDKDIVTRLLNSEVVVTDLYLSHRLGDISVFSVSVPVARDGEVIGALRSLLMANLLIGNPGETEYNHVHNYLMRKNGDLLLSESGYENGNVNLLTSLRENGAGERNLKQVTDLLNGQAEGLVHLDETGRRGSFITASDLGYNDWVLVSIANTQDLEDFSSSIMRNTVTLVVALTAFFALLVSAAWLIYWRQRQKLVASEVRYDLLSKFSDTILFEYDYKQKKLSFTPNVSVRFNIQNIDIYPYDTNYLFTVLHPDDVALLRRALDEKLPITSEQTQQFTMRFLDREGVYRFMECEAYMIRDPKGQPAMMVGKVSDVHEQTVREQELVESSIKDSMTGLLNHEATKQQIDTLLQTGLPGYLFMVDVDNFKLINDNNGHSVGDLMLCKLSDLLKQVFRQEDVLGRIGGDEFVIYMHNVADKRIAQKKAKLLLSVVRQWRDPKFSVSIGIAASPANGTTFETLFKSADAAMYQAKYLGKNRSYVAELSIHS